MPNARPLRALVLALALGLAAGAGAAAAEEEPGWSYALWNELMSPYCPGRTLADCPSDQAEQLRIWIVQQEEAGRSRAAVEEELYRQFGDVLLSAPRAEGMGLAAYVIPVVAFLAGGALVAYFLRRNAASAPETGRPAPPAPVDPELERRVERELAG